MNENKTIAKLLRDMADKLDGSSSALSENKEGLAFAFSWAHTSGKELTHSSIVVNRNASVVLRTLLRGEVGNSVRSMDGIEDRYQEMQRSVPNTSTLN